MNLLRKLLFPVVPIYYLVTWLRNILYDLGVKRSTSYDLPVICVGNLSVGGTGKTPMIEYLIRLLKDDYKVATLSRGYKRKTSGFLLADKNATADTLGDEPFQFYTKFKDEVLVAVDSDRRCGIEHLKSYNPDIILLDDAFQHRKVKAGFNILLSTYNKPFYRDIVLPTGDLREPRRGAERADVIVITKCPETIIEKEKSDIINRIKPKDNQNVFFSSIVYSNIVYSKNETKTLIKLENFCLVTGIANATPMVNFLKLKGLNFEHQHYKDHHNFSQDEINILAKKSLILTTEKDFMRLKPYPILKDKLFYLPITAVIDRPLKFNDTIKAFIKC